MATFRVTKPTGPRSGQERRHRRERAERRNRNRAKASLGPPGGVCVWTYPAIRTVTVRRRSHTIRLGRAKSARRAAVDAAAGYCNGYGKPRKLALTCGTITVQRPRGRGLAERFVSRMLPLFTRRTKQVGELLPQLYLHGLGLGDFELIRPSLGHVHHMKRSSFNRSNTGILARLYRSQSQTSSDTVERLSCSSAVTVHAIAS